MLRRHAVPLVVWLAACALALGLVARRSTEGEIVGISRGRVVHAAAPIAGRILSVEVVPGDAVRAGQVVARLDDGVISGQVAAVEAEAERLRAEHAEVQSLVDAEAEGRRIDWTAESRAFDADAVELERAAHELRTTLEAERKMLDGLEVELVNLETGAAAGLVARIELERVRFARAAAAARIAATERHLADVEQRREEVAERGAAFRSREPDRPSGAIAAEHLERAVRAQEALRAELEALRDQHVLRAPCDGLVVDLQGRAGDALVRRPGEAVLRLPGEAVAAGEPVVAIAESRPREIVAYLDERAAADLAPGQTVLVAPRARPRAPSPARVLSVSPVVERLPERLWTGPGIPSWGRPVLIEAPDDLDLLPGEVVSGRWR